MPPDAGPLLSVVVPIFDAGGYLAPCLESLAASRLTDLEVICVDDASTDGSGALADRFASHDSRFRVLHVRNGGLGLARNIGAAEATGRYLAFADSDDRVPPGAYEQLCGTLERSGSDLSAGRVRRFTDTRSWRSALHIRAITDAAQGTHISRRPSLVYDTTAWNKVFRRSFWDAHGLRFPLGVMYEDMPVMIRAHVLAKAVDLVTSEVYEWRGRSDGVLSLSQRSAELKNMHDRMTALAFVGDFLTGHDLTTARREFDRKVLVVDLPLYLPLLDAADQEYRTRFARHVQRYVESVEPRTVDQFPVWDRVTFELLRRGRFTQAAQLSAARAESRDEFDVRRKGVRLYAQLPYLRDREVGVPHAAYDVTTRLPVATAVEELSVRNDTLVVKGFAFIRGVSLNHWWSAVRYVQIGGRNSGRLRRRMRSRRRLDLTAEHGLAAIGYDRAGFEVRIPLSALPVPATGDGSFGVHLKIVTPSARRGVPLGQGGAAPTSTRVASVRADGTYVSVHTNPQGLLRITTRRTYALAQRVTVDGRGDRVVCELRLPGPSPATAQLILRPRDGRWAPIQVALVQRGPDPLDVTAVVPLSAIAAQRTWRATVEDGREAGAMVVLASPEFRLDPGPERGPTEVTARIAAAGALSLACRATRTASATV